MVIGVDYSHFNNGCSWGLTSTSRVFRYQTANKVFPPVTG